MMKKIIGFIICILFLATTFYPVIGITNQIKYVNSEAEQNPEISTTMKPLSSGRDTNNVWVNPSPKTIGGTLTPREYPAMAYNSSADRVVMFGGSGDPGKLDDTWVYNFSDNKWYNMNPSVAPSGRYGHAMVYDSDADMTIMFGGLDDAGNCNDTWVYNASDNKWYDMSPDTVGGTLSPRYLMNMVYDSTSKRTIMFGGVGAGGFNDTWVYNASDNKWYDMSPDTVGGTLNQTYAHGMAYDSSADRTIMFGGGNAMGDTWTGDTWVYNLSGGVNKWYKRSPDTVGGTLWDRCALTMCYDSDADRTILFGGQKDGGSAQWNDTWVYNYTDNRWCNVSYSVVGGDFYRREFSDIVYDSTNQRIVLFGGFSNDVGIGEELNDTWIYKYNTGNEPPNTPTNPEPDNGSIYVEIDTDISWYCWDPDLDDLTYDVYFEEDDSTPDVKVSSNQTETTYDPGTMELDTTYYWQIVAWDTEGHSTIGPVWHFTTEGPNNPPYTPSDPDPEDDATDVDVDANLSWTGGDPNPNDTVTYDVYFEADDSTPDVLVSNNQTDTTYDPGTMYGNTQYFWQIIAWDNDGASAEGPVWSFTTENLPPYTPSNPTPANHATNVDVNADLYWDGGDPDPEDTVTYDVYFGTSSNPPKVASNISDTNYDPGTMEYLTKYYWKIISWDNHGASSSGPLWDFTTGSEPNDPPYPPSNPDPSDGATDVSISVVLSWDCSDPDGDEIFYDVYLEADDETPDVLVADDITETTYDAGILDYGTIYYWKIVAIDEHSASTQGPIWSFTTVINSPPDAPDIDGPDRGSPGTTYEYGLTSVDPEAHDIAEFIIKWGDNSGEETIVGPFESGVEVFASHSWIEKGTYTIQAKAIDVFGAESNWSQFEVKIPRTRATFNHLFHWFLNRFPLLEKLLSLIIAS